ncbi:hypothetical protein [Saccharopolyspora shandongensis]|uniref:hypothetical protein n=1 Tax=Saccharopolyspora shandongensis TaxID=418495 RepID=UPI0033D728B2
MEVVWALAFWIYLIFALTWWLLIPIAAGFVISVVATIVRSHPRAAWHRPGLWGRLGAGSVLAFLATVGYGMTAMASFAQKDPGECTVDDDLRGNHPIMDWPLSDTSCGGYESVPTFVNPAICLFAVVFLASMVAMITTLRRARARLK